MVGLQVHGIDSRKVVYKEVVEVQSNYKKPYFWWFGNPFYGDSAGSNRIRKDKVVYLLDLFQGMGKKGRCDLVGGAPEDDWINAGLCWCFIHVSVILILWGADPILRTGCGI